MNDQKCMDMLEMGEPLGMKMENIGPTDGMMGAPNRQQMAMHQSSGQIFHSEQSISPFGPSGGIPRMMPEAGSGMYGVRKGHGSPLGGNEIGHSMGPLGGGEDGLGNRQSSPFMVPTTSDPHYAQQFHNFQQQLYATNTRGVQGQANSQSESGQPFFGIK
jgi:hypothetical protein